MTQKIMHIDMDSFFASIEANRRNLEGEPIVVCVYSGRTENSGAVSTASYEAREIGIHAGMPIMRAQKIASETDKEVHFLDVDKEYYQQVGDNIKEEILDEFSEKIERASIDEFYIDLTEEFESFEEAEEAGKKIQKEIKEEFSLSCSVGLASNKLVAKIASDRDKPEGLTVVRTEDRKEFMESLELEEIHGIGQKTREKLNEIGIETVKDLANADRKELVDKFGEKQGVKLQRKARGKDDTKVEETMQKQLTRLTTLDHNTRSEDYLEEYLENLSEELSNRVEDKELVFGRVVFLVIDTDLEMHTRSESLKAKVDDRETIFEKGKEMMNEFMSDFDGEVRRVGLRVADLDKSRGQTTFDDF